MHSAIFVDSPTDYIIKLMILQETSSGQSSSTPCRANCGDDFTNSLRVRAAPVSAIIFKKQNLARVIGHEAEDS